jgi:hypothetical protein
VKVPAAAFGRFKVPDTCQVSVSGLWKAVCVNHSLVEKACGLAPLTSILKNGTSKKAEEPKGNYFRSRKQTGEYHLGRCTGAENLSQSEICFSESQVL